MTTKEIYIAIQQGLQNSNSFVYNSYEEEELDLEFNTTVNLFIEDVIASSINKTEKAFENIQTVLDDLRLLKVVNSSIPLVNNVGNLPTEYRHRINDRTSLTYCGQPRIVPKRLYESESLYKAIENPFERPKWYSPISIIENNTIRVYLPSQVTATTVIMDFIRNPKKLIYDISTVNNEWSDTEFPLNTMYKLIDLKEF